MLSSTTSWEQAKHRLGIYIPTDLTRVPYVTRSAIHKNIYFDFAFVAGKGEPYEGQVIWRESKASPTLHLDGYWVADENIAWLDALCG